MSLAHGLQFEGAPHLVAEDGRVHRVSRPWGGVSGEGRGVCRCGAYSDILPSAHQRKKWHREHKREVGA